MVGWWRRPESPGRRRSREADEQRALAMRRGPDCGNPDHDHCMRRLGQVLAELAEVRAERDLWRARCAVTVANPPAKPETLKAA